MAILEQVLVNGEPVLLGSGLEGRIASSIERNGAGSCVVLQVAVGQKSYSYAFPAACAGSGGGGGPASIPPEVNRLNQIYRSALEQMQRNTAAIRAAVLEFIRSL